LGGAIGLVAILVIANVAGLLRIPVGPVHAAGFGLGLGSASPDVPVCVGLDLSNAWPAAATIESVRLVNPSDGLRLVEARLIRPEASPTNGGLGVGNCDSPGIEDLRLYSDYDPLPGSLPGNSSVTDGFMWIAVLADRSGELVFDALEIHYRVGPFAFVDRVRITFSACVLPMPSGAICPSGAQP
jgi:hypothetical protein